MERTKPRLKASTLIERAWFQTPIEALGQLSAADIVDKLSGRSEFDLSLEQKRAWHRQAELLQPALAGMRGKIYFEFEIPRMGRRADAVLSMQGRLLVLEFKDGAKSFLGADLDQACDYALDLKYFHEGSHELRIVPMLVATAATPVAFALTEHPRQQGVYWPLRVAGIDLRAAIEHVLAEIPSDPDFRVDAWENSRYSPTPTIVEAARALYAGHRVEDIVRNDAGGEHLRRTHGYLRDLAERMRKSGGKAISFVTGVPGAGKTLVGMNLATENPGATNAEKTNCVYLSGNGPLVDVLREALARDHVVRQLERGRRLRKGEARTKVKSFIQNIHHFRDEYIKDRKNPPADHVVIFDEAQRSWNLQQTRNFLKRRKRIDDFPMSEPEFLLSCMDRHEDWAAVVCLVGEGQEINTGEAGIGEWLRSAARSFGHWEVHVSPNLGHDEYGARKALASVERIHYSEDLHLRVSVRSFRAERLSDFVNALLDHEAESARRLLDDIRDRYPIVLTRDLRRARAWLREQASGGERYGLLVSSHAERLKPHAVDVRTPVDPVKWFLDGKDDVRSSYYLEDAATQFHVQGLELDWACVCWDGDFRRVEGGWSNHSFRKNRWQRINNEARRAYQKNAYRVLLTRARQGMVICVPEGAATDPTRRTEYYDGTYAYLEGAGIPAL